MVRCGDCKYCYGLDRSFEVLACHRHAPVPRVTQADDSDTYVTVWPWVDADDGCGDGELRE